MNKFSLALIVSISLASCGGKMEQQTAASQAEDHSQHQMATEKPAASKSPKKTAMEIVDGNHIHIDYSSPSVRGRQIFGGLVAYGEVWATGAHKATWIQFDKPVTIGDQKIPAGKYGLFTIPGKQEWTVILNSVWDMHLADDYDPNKDVIRITCSPETLENTVESLTYSVQKIASQTTEISMAWDKTKIKFVVTNS
ncbi:MAG: DUF2911 domain-containing protein [Algoriphagus sp.]|jgi:hypothetical protein